MSVSAGEALAQVGLELAVVAVEEALELGPKMQLKQLNLLLGQYPTWWWHGKNSNRCYYMLTPRNLRCTGAGSTARNSRIFVGRHTQ